MIGFVNSLSLLKSTSRSSKMANGTDESRLKEVVKAAIIEVLEERRDLLRGAIASGEPAQLLAAGAVRPNVGMSSTVKTIIFWVVLLLTAVLLYQIVAIRRSVIMH